MKFRILLFVFLLVCISNNVFSQGQAYMIPDLGSPGMNTYVEFIAPTNSMNYFGNDGFYMNSSGDDVRVVAKNNPENVIVGPCIVSWNGRVVSTQIMVPPTVIPNSANWNEVDPEFKIELQVIVNGNPVGNSEDFIFYVISAEDFSVAGNQIDAIKKRSPRGAILCKNLYLPANQEVKFGEVDIDPTTPGNQAYLPAFLLVKEKIHGNGSTISVDGGNGNGGSSGHGGNGGPGGGGGGGQWVDHIFAKHGTNGGAGFVGGGAGGTNHYVSGSGHRKSKGEGSGENNGSINGVTAPMPEWSWEAAGGGTGHPFGLSGQNCGDGNNHNPDVTLGYGGGQGYTQNTDGSGGGYGADGEAKTDAARGKVHGNKFIIPFAGGSGGASGNPEAPAFPPGKSEYAGSGGGGGGAIRIFAEEIINLTVTANGGDGEDREHNGGGGSGGAIDISSKTLSVAGKIIACATGGNRETSGYEGGDGRVVLNNPYRDSKIFRKTDWPNSEESMNKGIGFDETTEIMLGETKNIVLYSSTNTELYRIKQGQTEWELIETFNTAGEIHYNYTIPADATHKYECLVLVDKVAGSGSGGKHDYEPKEIMTQASANVIQILDKGPILSCQKTVTADNVCYNELPHTITFTIENVGGSSLEIDIPNDCFVNGVPGMTLISPKTRTFSLASNQTETIKILYNPNLTNNLENIEEIFRFNHNDVSKANPFEVEININKVEYFKLTTKDSKDFGMISVNETASKDIRFTVEGNTPVRAVKMPVLDAPFSVVNMTPPAGTLINPGEKLTLTVEFTPTIDGVYPAQTYVGAEGFVMETANGCNEEYRHEYNGAGTRDSISFPTNVVDFGLLSWCADDTTSELVVVRNLSRTSSVKILKGYFEGADADVFECSYPTNNFPHTMNTYDESGLTNGDRFSCTFYITPQNISKSGVLTADYVLETDLDAPYDIIRISIRAEIAESDLMTNPNEIDFSDIDLGYDSHTEILVIKNNGKFAERISQIISDPQMNITISSGTETIAPNGGEVEYEVQFKPMPGMASTGYIEFTIDSICPNNLRIPIKYNALKSVITMEDIDYGKMQWCETTTNNYKLDVAELINNSNAPFTVIKGSEKITNRQTDEIFTLNPDDGGLKTDKKIEPGEKHQSHAIFVNARAANAPGVYEADYHVKVYQNGIEHDTTLAMRVEINYSTIDVHDSETHFGDVTEKKTKRMTVELENTSDYDLTIAGVEYPKTSEFSIITPNLIGMSVPASGTILFEVEFAPGKPGIFKDQIELTLKIGECDDVYTVELDGEGIKARTINLEMPNDLIVSPTLDNLSLPVFIHINSDEQEFTGYDIDEIAISYNPHLFFFKSVSGGNGKAEFISNTTIADNKQVLKFKMTNVDLMADTTILATINGAVLLGDATETDFHFDHVVLNANGEVSDTVFQHGHIKIDICQEGGDRLIHRTDGELSMTLTPNPATEYVDILIEAFEAGEYHLYFYAITGAEIERKILNKSDAGHSELKDNFTFTNLAKGVYYIKLVTPSGIEVIETLIVE